jgi:hypothetical protein
MIESAAQAKLKPSERIIAWLLPSTPVLVFVLVFWLSLFFMPQMLNGDGDLGRHLTTGNLILTTGQIPTHDLFSHTMNGAALVPKEWISQVLFALAFRVAGLNGVAWLTALVLAATYGILTIVLRRAGVRAIVALAAGVTACVVGSLHALARPHLFTWLFFALFLLVLEEYRRNRRWRTLWALPFLMLAWANLHGAFISGLTLVAFYAVGAALERKWQQAAELIGLEGILILASFVNPAGPQLITHVFATLGDRFIVDNTVEFQSPNFHMISVWPFAALLGFSLAVVGRSSRRLEWTPLLVLGGWTLFALYSSRNIPLYAQAAVVALAPRVEGLIDEMLPAAKRFLTRTDEIDRLVSGWVWAALVVILLVGAEASGAKLDVRGMGNRFDPHVFPVAAVDALHDALPSGKVFNEFTWGGYLIYRLWPQEHVFIDGWTDMYGDTLTREYLQTINAEPGWDQVLERYQVQWVIIPPTRALAAQLDESPNWTRRYEDTTAGVWVRR